MKFTHFFLFLAIGIGTLSCVSSFTTSAEYDKKTDFSAYKTFSFLPWREDVSTRISQEAQNKLYAAAKTEMEKRGYTHVQNGADLVVGISVLIEEKVEYRTDGSVNYNVGYGYYGYYGGMGMGYTGPTTITPYYYNDGTIIVDVFDEAKKNLIWQGYGFDKLEDQPSKNIQKIETYMKYIFYKYPYKGTKK